MPSVKPFKRIGVTVVPAGLGNWIASLSLLLLPEYSALGSTALGLSLAGELPLCFWPLIQGG